MEPEDKKFQEFLLKIETTFGIWNCLEIISNLEEFRRWLKEYHHLDDFGTLFEGYKFFLETVVRSLINAIHDDRSLGLEEDIVFDRLRFVGDPLSKVPNTCEKIVVMKNIYINLRAIKKAKNLDELKASLVQFKGNILGVFRKIFDGYVEVVPGLNISKTEALRYTTMDFTLIFLNDFHKGLPKGYIFTIIPYKLSFDRQRLFFEGYKYSLQFVWYNLLGEDFHSSSVRDLHLAEDWGWGESGSAAKLEDMMAANSDLVVIEKKDLSLEEIEEMEEDFPGFKELIEGWRSRGAERSGTETSNTMDSFFEKIRDEHISPFEERYGLTSLYTKIFRYKEIVPKAILGKLLNPVPAPQLSIEEQIHSNLLWYDIELLDASASAIFKGVPAFISLLVGTVETKRLLDIKEKTYVCKFTHPLGWGNDYSYGVLIETFGSTGIADYSGWMLFFDCCGDHSGFAGSLHQKAELYIKIYQENNLVELREMVIEKEKF